MKYIKHYSCRRFTRIGIFLTVFVFSIAPEIVRAQDDVGSTQSALVSGQNDVSSQVADAVVLISGGCTGTLIAPRLVVTAGHCLQHNPPAGLPRTNETTGGLPATNDGNKDFELPGVWYPLFDYPNGIEIKFGNIRSNPTFTVRAFYYNHPGFADVIILGLDRPVPEEVAYPSAVLTRLPEGGDPAKFWQNKELEMVGWGFTDRCTGSAWAQVRQRADAVLGAYPHKVGPSRDEVRPNQMYVRGKNGGSVAQGDSGGPVFWMYGGRRYLVGTLQGCETSGGRYFASWATGGMDGLGKSRPNLAAWYNRVLSPGFYFEMPHGITSDVRDVALCADGSVYQLRGDRHLWKQENWAIEASGWRLERTLSEPISSISCSTNQIVYIARDRDFWQLNSRGEPVQLGHLANTISLGSTEDASLDFPFYWALNRDKKLWMNNNGGRDGQWQHVGTPRRTRAIASAGSRVFALNEDGTLWMNENGGRDRQWKPLGKVPEGTYQIAAARVGQTDDAKLLALTENRIYVGRVEPGGHVPSRVRAGSTEVFEEPEYGQYRLDWCYNWGEECGQPAANAFCKLKGFDVAQPVTLANNFARDIGNVVQTYTIGAGRVCADATCDGFSTITCKK